MSELSVLIARRGQLKASLTRLATYIRNNSERDIDVDQIKIRAEKARETWKDFQQVQTQVEELEGTNENTERYRNEFEDLFYENISKCEKILRTAIGYTSSTVSNVLPNNTTASINDYSPSNSGNIHAQSAVKLAAIQIPKFTGVYTKWAAFHDIFSALIHTNDSFSDIQKNFYLRSSLAEDAENVIKCLQITSNNYKVAWDSLIARYDNKRVLIQVHTQSLFDLEPVKKESSLQLRKLVDALTGYLKALESLGKRPKEWGSLLLHLVMSKLDVKTMHEWEITSSKTDIYSTTELLEFLQSPFRVLEAIESSTQINMSQENNRKTTSSSKRATIRTNAFAIMSDIKCCLCKQSHTIYRCPTFTNLSISDRIKKAMELKLCKICLRLHKGEKCQSRNCRICARPHNSLLHLPRSDNNDKSTQTKSSLIMMHDKTDNEDDSTTTVSVNAHTSHESNYQILLSTAEVIAYDFKRNPVLCRVLLDSGSQHNFITQAMVQHLRLKRTKTSSAIIGINESSHTASHSVTITIKSRVTNYSSNLKLFVLPKLTTNIPLLPVNLSSFKIPTDLTLADPSFDTPQVIDMIIGAEIFFDLLINEQIRPTTSGPVLQNTQFGWTIAGPVSRSININENSSVSLFAHASMETIEEKMAAFWRIEELQREDIFTAEERACKQHFEENVRRDDNGRFIVVTI